MIKPNSNGIPVVFASTFDRETGEAKKGFRDSPVWDWLAIALCLIAGVTLILNTHPDGDGMWFWYAVDLRQGVRMYRDLHLGLQPLYVLLTAAFQGLLGTSWCASKVFPFLQLLAFLTLLLGISRFAPLPRWQRAVLVLAAFLFIVQPSTYRFDDYHVTSDIFTLGSLLLWLHLDQRLPLPSTILRYAFGVGLCCGLAAMTRLNDGAAIGVAASLMFAMRYPRHSIRALSALVAGLVAAVTLVLLLVHDSPSEWWHWSITAAGQIKGGTGSILYAPLLLPLHLMLHILFARTPLVIGYVALLAFGVSRVQRQYGQVPMRRFIGTVCAWLLVLLIAMVPLVRRTQVSFSLEMSVRVATLLFLLASVVLLAWACFRLLQGRSLRQRSALLLLWLPLLHLIGGALTAANTLPDPYLSFAMLLLLWPMLVSPPVARTCALPILANVVLLMAIIVGGKIAHPYFWWNYDDGPVYRDRVWYRHPDFGPMYIERPQLALMAGLCDRVHSGSGMGGLLSMPFPYANYFCNVPPWKGYVQTWYDTSGADTIQALVSQLQKAPPRWIAYEYNPNAVEGHERTYYHGKAIPHRALQGLVVNKITTGGWTLRLHQCSRLSEWLLIETVHVPDAENVLRSGFKPEGALCR